ncbi:MAG TPA: restriction endonuclease subunit S [Pyrinomonadaceae bacterium]|jgi:type I restriction enzyme S subunit|nr:restriction endonuclease subunit S [Pyrinomonadaceae bacterium]
MKFYDKYKPSGINWVGDIPDHWENKRVKHLFDEYSGNGFPEEMQGKHGGDFPFFKVSDLNKDEVYVHISNNWVSTEDVENKRWNIIPPKSILTAKIGEALRKNHRKINLIPCVIDNNCIALHPINLNYKFAYYLLNLIDFDWFTNPGTVPSVSVEKLKNFPIILPSPDEQNAIADYLDKKTAQIDLLISNKVRLIEMLKEERTAIINQATTRGINPHVKLKPSGIAWIGDIPEHWEVKKLRYVANKVLTGSTPPSNREEYYEADLNWFTPSDFSEKMLLTDSKRKVSNLAVRDDVVKLFPANSILLVGIGATLGKVGYIKETASSNQQINAIAMDSLEKAKFYSYFFHVNQRNILGLANAATLAILNQSQIKDIPLIVPANNNEIREALDFIETTTGKIGATIVKIEREIGFMREYRMSLISEVVTGKIKVV